MPLTIFLEPVGPMPRPASVLSDLTAAFSRPAFFSRVAYCSSASVMTFSCGAPCDALVDSVKILVTGV